MPKLRTQSCSRRAPFRMSLFLLAALSACAEEDMDGDQAPETETAAMIPLTPQELLLGRWTSDISESPICNDGVFLTTYEFSPADPDDPVQNGGQIRLTVDEDYTRDDGSPCSCIHTFTGIYQHQDDAILFGLRDQDVRFCDGSTLTPETDDFGNLDDAAAFGMTLGGILTVDDSRLIINTRMYERAP